MPDLRLTNLCFNLSILLIKHLWSSFKAPINSTILKLQNSCDVFRSSSGNDKNGLKLQTHLLKVQGSQYDYYKS